MDTQVVPIVQKSIIPFSFEGMRLKESCWIEGKPYFTPRAIGELLEYEHPYFAVRKIIDRNPHIKQFATIPKLGIVEGGREVVREVEVYDPIGFQLIINKSNQPKAITFQIAVAHLIWAYVTGNIKPFKWSEDVKSSLAQIISIPCGRKRGQMVKDMAKEMNVSYKTIYGWARKMNGENLKVAGGKPKRTRADKGKTAFPEQKAVVMEYHEAHPERGYKAVYTGLNGAVPLHRIRCWLKSISIH